MGGAGQDGMVILSPEETIELEHDDRIARLRRSVGRLGLQPAPRFSTVRVPASRMPPNFRVETPILRVSFSERTFFDTAQWVILDTGHAAIRAVAEAIRGEAPDAAVFVAGHTDNRGSEPYNYNLSVQRANAVAEALFALGVGEMALWRVGFGEAAPLYVNDSDEHRAFNRRVEFLFGARVEPVVDVLSRQLDEVCIAATPAESRRCRTEAEVRPEFAAEQVTRRPTGVPLTPRRQSAPSPGQRRPSGPAAPAPEAVAAPRRIAIDLNNRRRVIAAPTR